MAIDISIEILSLKYNACSCCHFLIALNTHYWHFLIALNTHYCHFLIALNTLNLHLHRLLTHPASEHPERYDEDEDTAPHPLVDTHDISEEEKTVILRIWLLKDEIRVSYSASS